MFYRLWYVCTCICHFKGISGVDVGFYRFCFWRQDLLYIYIHMYILKRTPIRAVCPLHQLLMMTMYKGLNALHACVATVCRFTFTLIQLILSMISSNGMKRFYRWLHINQRRSCELIKLKLLSTLYRVEMYMHSFLFLVI